METKNELAPSSFAVVAGALPYQLRLESMLSGEPRSSLLAASVSFTLGTLALCSTPCVPHPLPAVNRTMQAPWYVGGFLGVICLTATIILAPLLGAATMVGLVVAGQMLASITLDHLV